MREKRGAFLRRKDGEGQVSIRALFLGFCSVEGRCVLDLAGCQLARLERSTYHFRNFCKNKIEGKLIQLSCFFEKLRIARLFFQFSRVYIRVARVRNFSKNKIEGKYTDVFQFYVAWNLNIRNPSLSNRANSRALNPRWSRYEFMDVERSRNHALYIYIYIQTVSTDSTCHHFYPTGYPPSDLPTPYHSLRGWSSIMASPPPPTLEFQRTYPRFPKGPSSIIQRPEESLPVVENRPIGGEPFFR